jgi:hypothetical protein
MKISVYNSVLEWFGKHIFSVYILQRIPMILLASMGIGYSHRYFFLVISIAITILLSQLFDTVVAYCTNIVWEKRENG